MMRLALQLKNEYHEFLTLLLVGIVTISVDFGVYSILSRNLMFFSKHFVLAKAFSFIAAIVCSFYLKTFNKTGKISLKEVIRFYSTIGSGIFINVGVVYFFHGVLGFYDLAALFIAMLFTLIWSFAFSKLWIFKPAY